LHLQLLLTAFSYEPKATNQQEINITRIGLDNRTQHENENQIWMSKPAFYAMAAQS
jgi:hypothetical protein